jgi:hypothetical protein
MVQVYIPEVRKLHPTSFSNPILHNLKWKSPKKGTMNPIFEIHEIASSLIQECFRIQKAIGPPKSLTVPNAVVCSESGEDSCLFVYYACNPVNLLKICLQTCHDLC